MMVYDRLWIVGERYCSGLYTGNSVYRLTAYNENLEGNMAENSKEYSQSIRMSQETADIIKARAQKRGWSFNMMVVYILDKEVKEAERKR